MSASMNDFIRAAARRGVTTTTPADPLSPTPTRRAATADAGAGSGGNFDGPMGQSEHPVNQRIRAAFRGKGSH